MSLFQELNSLLDEFGFKQISSQEVTVQFGELFSGEIIWDKDTYTYTMAKTDKCFYSEKPGVELINENGRADGGWSGFKNGIYHRYEFPSEHCFRIIK